MTSLFVYCRKLLERVKMLTVTKSHITRDISDISLEIAFDFF